MLAVRSFRSEEEATGANRLEAKRFLGRQAIRIANDTPYGLANAVRHWEHHVMGVSEVYSADAARCARVAGELKSGVVWENCSQADRWHRRSGRPGAVPFDTLRGSTGPGQRLWLRTRPCRAQRVGRNWLLWAL